MIQSRKIEFVISKESKEMLDQQSKICNWLYNQLITIIKKNNEMMTLSSLFKLSNQLKKANDFLNSLEDSLLNNVIYRLYKNYKALNREINKLNYNSWINNWYSLQFNKPNKHFKLLSKNQLLIYLGNNKKVIELKLKRNNNLRIIDCIKFIIITKDINSFYVIFVFERKEITKKPINNFISIDQNHSNFFVGVDNNGNSFEIKQLKIHKYYEKEIAKVKSKMTKCNKVYKEINQEGKEVFLISNRYKKLKITIQKLSRRKQEQVKQSCYAIANWVAKNYDLVIIGSYAPSLKLAPYRDMRRIMLNQSTISYFKNILQWVMKRSGKKLVIIDERNTTKICCICQASEIKEPNIRIFQCYKCKNIINRDINSCINLAKKAKLLSSQDYVNWELSKFTYTIKWNLFKSKLLLIDELKKEKEISFA